MRAVAEALLDHTPAYDQHRTGEPWRCMDCPGQPRFATYKSFVAHVVADLEQMQRVCIAEAADALPQYTLIEHGGRAYWHRDQEWGWWRRIDTQTTGDVPTPDLLPMRVLWIPGDAP